MGDMGLGQKVREALDTERQHAAERAAKAAQARSPTKDSFDDIEQTRAELDKAIAIMETNALKVQATQSGSAGRIKTSHAEIELLQNYETVTEMMIAVVMKTDQ